MSRLDGAAGAIDELIAALASGRAHAAQAWKDGIAGRLESTLDEALTELRSLSRELRDTAALCDAAERELSDS